MFLFRQFGKAPSGDEYVKIKKSVNYKNNSFQNLSSTEMMTGNMSYMQLMWHFINRPSYCVPARPLPSVKTNLHNIQSSNAVIVWFGHSSYFIRVNHKNILVDPVFSGHASPFSFTAKSFPGANVYTVADMPPIDLLILTHDHYDHLDYDTVLRLKGKVKQICTSLGVGSHLRYWGFDKERIIEFDWWQERKLFDDMRLTAAPARHFSGRSFTRNKSLWSSFILQTPGCNIYLGGDSGYDTHFAEIGKRFGPFEIAVLECGQYNENWKYIHMMPEQTVQAAIDLQSKMLMPVHWGKFCLSLHPWYQPAQRVQGAAKERGQAITTPYIGEPVILNENYPATQWWQQFV
ncbi:MAG TPA: MBL fold metallo-hydrolase [Chitinophagaceae bacterium]|nr:MBL fold metallo-hydrolase [Chitinophagaceae bacterium]